MSDSLSKERFRLAKCMTRCPVSAVQLPISQNRPWVTAGVTQFAAILQ